MKGKNFHMKKLIFAIALVLGLCLIFTGVFTGCGEKELVKVRLNEVTHSIFYAPQYAALNLGFFKDEGLDIELVNGQGADAVDRKPYS